MNIYNGALIDNRSEEEKLKDFKFEEIVASAKPVNWVEKKPESIRKFPIFNQNGSGSCVAQTMAKILGIMYWLKNQDYVHFSATHIYQRRANKPQGGMNGVDAFEIARKGVTLEELVESQNMSDSQMDSIKIEKYKEEVGEVFKIANYIIAPNKDIDTIASIIQETGKGVMVWYYFNHDEWTDTPEVKRNIELYAGSTSRHSVTAVDFTLVNGKKCLVIDDSWGPGYGKGGQRIITEDFHKQRNFFAGYPMTFKFEESEIIEKYTFTKSMKQGSTGTEVRELQKFLQKKGFFPSNITPTEYFGSVTKKAVIDFQLSRGLVGDGIVGKNTLLELNK